MGTRSGIAERLPRRMVRWIGRKWARVAYARHIEPTWLERVEQAVPIRGLNAELRVVHLSDFHLNRPAGLDYVRRSIELANGCKPDFVALTGDFIHAGFRYVEMIAELMGELQSRYGVFAVLGNHDYAVRSVWGHRRKSRLPSMLTAALESRGVRVLRNEAITLHHSESRFTIAGVEDLWSRRTDVDRTLTAIPADQPRIILAHNPQTIELLGGHRCDLMLSGHTHGGQINLPRAGPPILSRRMRRYRAGLVTVSGQMVYVNRGIGCGFAWRYRARPEVTVLRLIAPDHTLVHEPSRASSRFSQRIGWGAS